MAAYFGFGALMNLVSVRMRNIHPRSSCAAKLSGFRLVFGGSHGMATVLPSPGDVVHGVLHMVTEEEKLRLDNTESSYEELKTQVETGALVALVPTNPYLVRILQKCACFKLMNDYTQSYRSAMVSVRQECEL